LVSYDLDYFGAVQRIYDYIVSYCGGELPGDLVKTELLSITWAVQPNEFLLIY